MEAENLINYLKNVVNELENNKKELEKHDLEYKTLLNKINSIENILLDIKKAIL